VVDYASHRARFNFQSNKTALMLIGIGLFNVILTTITMFNIKQERDEKVLIQEDKERMDDEAEQGVVEGQD